MKRLNQLLKSFKKNMKPPKCLRVFLASLIFISTIASARDLNVLIVDTGIFPHKDFNSHILAKDLGTFDFKDSNDHGTFVAGLILNGTCKEVKVHSCAFYNLTPEDHNSQNAIKCFKRALEEKPDIINFSAGGQDSDLEEIIVLKQLEKLNITFVTAAGNNGQDLKEFNYYPAKYGFKNMVVVGNLLPNGKRNPSSNYNLDGMKWIVGTNISSTMPDNKYGTMTGTSMSTAIYTNQWLLQKCKEQNGNH